MVKKAKTSKASAKSGKKARSKKAMSKASAKKKPAKKAVKKSKKKAAKKKAAHSSVAPTAAPMSANTDLSIGLERHTRAPTADQLYTQLKTCLARITGFQPNQIFTTDSLAGKFHFDAAGLRQLPGKLVACLAEAGFHIQRPLTTGAFQTASTVGHVAGILNTAYGV